MTHLEVSGNYLSKEAHSCWSFHQILGAGIIPLVLPGIIGGIGAGRKRRSIEKKLKTVEDSAYVDSGRKLKSLFQKIVKPSQRYRKSGTV